MNNPLATETVLGLPVEETYHIAETVLPGGKVIKQLFQRVRLPDGSQDWQLVDEKIKAFDARFSGTETVPDPWKPVDTEPITKNEPTTRETPETVAQGGMTRMDMRRQLVLGLGDPNFIIQNKGLDAQRIKFFQLHPSTLTLLVMMAKAHGGQWGEVAKYLKPVYPDAL